MSLHSFDPAIAAKVGLNAAVIYQNILFWTEKNLVNGRNVKDGKVWTYNSIKAWGELFPYFSPDQIRRALAKLVEAGLIFEGNYNQSAYDRTKWYGVKTEIHLAETQNGSGQNHEPIPDIKPDIKPDTHHAPQVGQRFDEFWNAYPHRNGKKDKKAPCQTKYDKAVKSGVTEAEIIQAAKDYADDPDVKRGYGRAALTWLNQKGWADERTKDKRTFRDKPQSEWTAEDRKQAALQWM